MFIASLISDLVKGMTHLHYKTNLACHGNLKSSNCVITSRWVLKITDYGLHELRNSRNSEQDSICTGEHEHYRSKLWYFSFLSYDLERRSARQFLYPFSITYINKLGLSSFRFKEGTIYMKEGDILRFLAKLLVYIPKAFSFDTLYISSTTSKLSLFSLTLREKKK